jgi:hypothetical protein
MAQHIRNLTFHILKSFFPCLLLVGFHFSGFLNGWHLHLHTWTGAVRKKIKTVTSGSEYCNSNPSSAFLNQMFQ